jgi:hypothetical protein
VTGSEIFGEFNEKNGGEKMNKKIIGLTMIFLAVIMVATPLVGAAQACIIGRWSKPKVVSVTITSTAPSMGPYPNFFTAWSQKDSYLCASPLSSSVWSGVLATDEGPVSFDSQTDSYIVANMDTKKGNTLTIWTLENADGKFEGWIFRKTTYTAFVNWKVLGYTTDDYWSPNPQTATCTYYGVLTGEGLYAGQIIVLSGTGPYMGPVEGFLRK